MDGSFRPRPRLSVVLPARDEEASIEQVVSSVLARVAGHVADVEILVVDDGSRDRTAERVRGLATLHPAIRLLQHARPRGYGAALRTGFAACRFEWVFFTDADGQFPLLELPLALDSVRAREAIIGYRAPRADAIGRRALGRAWSMLARSTLGVAARDVDCAFKLFPRSLLDMAPLRSDGAAISPELLRAMTRAGLSIREIAVEHRPRLAGAPTGARLSVAMRALGELASMARR